MVRPLPITAIPTHDNREDPIENERRYRAEVENAFRTCILSIRSLDALIAQGSLGGGVPSGGTAGQVLSKINGDDFNSEWINLPAGQGVPPGGLAGQVLAKINGDDFNTEWVAQTGGGGGTSFLDPSDELDDSDATYFYFGWIDVGGGWLVERQLRSDSSSLYATVSNNPGYATLALAWPDRSILNYA